ncbi:MAG: hypothetical protein AB7P05_15895 [Hyphomonadaceae bacterium]
MVDWPRPDAIFTVMLQHNSITSGRRAHLAHAAVMGLHALCCGMPALMLAAATVSGAASGVVLLSDFLGKWHDFLHQHEMWILAVSAALVVLGGWLEAAARRQRRQGFPWLFAFSLFCFVANVTIILVHRAI